MMNSGQNQQIELLSKLALQGGGYSWNSTPISDSSSEDPNFYISWPEEAQRRERLGAARRRDNFLLAEPFVRAEEYGETGPRTPYTAPARVVPYVTESRLCRAGFRWRVVYQRARPNDRSWCDAGSKTRHFGSRSIRARSSRKSRTRKPPVRAAEAESDPPGSSTRCSRK